MTKRYRAENGCVIDNVTEITWYAGWQQWQAEEIANLLETGDKSHIVYRPGGVYIQDVLPRKKANHAS